MKIIFIRHAEPDYSIDSLTAKGWKEAKLLGQRVSKWENITQYYVSPLGRAQDTCNESMKLMGKTPITLDWLREFNYTVKNPTTGLDKRVPWDLHPSFWTTQEEMFDKDKWTDMKLYNTDRFKEQVKEVYDGIDNLLLTYGYRREGNLYVTDKENDDTTIVLFCHLGVSYVIWGHLLGISPALLWHTFFVAPSSVTILGCEERQPHIAMFRMQTVGDTSHLLNGNEPVSSSGYFTDSFQG